MRFFHKTTKNKKIKNNKKIANGDKCVIETQAFRMIKFKWKIGYWRRNGDFNESERGGDNQKK